MAIRSIVVGFDGSETSYRAFAMAVGLAGREHGSVHSCFVARLPATASLSGLVAPASLVCDHEVDDALAGFVAAELVRAGVAGDFTRSSGEVAAELERLAEAFGADLLVVGRSSHPHLHLGGVPRQLVARGRIPVLVVP